jgi:hypothetical protein
MAQVRIIPGLTGEPFAEPQVVSINRVEQEITWLIEMRDIGWDNSNTPLPEGPGGPNKAVQIDMTTDPKWTGGTPEPVGEMPIGLDKRHYKVQGPGPNNSSKPVFYKYMMWVVDTQGIHHRVQIRHGVTQEPVDPDIGNQPQP